jgi:hypothetical protein
LGAGVDILGAGEDIFEAGEDFLEAGDIQEAGEGISYLEEEILMGVDMIENEVMWMMVRRRA